MTTTDDNSGTNRCLSHYCHLLLSSVGPTIVICCCHLLVPLLSSVGPTIVICCCHLFLLQMTTTDDNSGTNRWQQQMTIVGQMTTDGNSGTPHYCHLLLSSVDNINRNRTIAICCHLSHYCHLLSSVCPTIVICCCHLFVPLLPSVVVICLSHYCHLLLSSVCPTIVICCCNRWQ
jgi:hypothetical protein